MINDTTPIPIAQLPNPFAPLRRAINPTMIPAAPNSTGE